MGFVLLYLITCWIVGSIAGRVWRSKGGDYSAGFWMGALLHLLGLFYVAFAHPPKSVGEARPGDQIVLARPLKLDRGGRLPRGEAGEVLSTSRVDGVDVVEIRTRRGTHLVASSGVVVTSIGSSREKKCPECAEEVKVEAAVCRFCGYRFRPPSD